MINYFVNFNFEYLNRLSIVGKTGKPWLVYQGVIEFSDLDYFIEI